MRWIFAFIAVLVLANVSLAGTAIVPTTTLNAEVANNTSASDYFSEKTNGNAGAGNVSDVSVKSLLYSGATTKVYAHLMPWFGGSNHMNVGYASNDPAQVREQVGAMRARGIDGVIIDWYGRNFTREDQTTHHFKQEGERLGGGFKFAVMEDVGALRKCAATKGCDVTTEMILDLNYAYNNYMKSPAYMRIDNRPVVFFFGVEAFSIDWNRVRSSVLGNPLFVRQNAGGFTDWQSDGSFGWVVIDRDDPNNIGLSYLDGFYTTGIKYPTKKTFGAVYKGFNDSLAAWHPTLYRLMKQNCGQTWLATWDRVKDFYSSSRQLQNMQLVTWNDYEEGTALETGIDNCVGVTASTEGTVVKWSIVGQQNTISHFRVFISTDGTQLMPVEDVPASSRSLDLKPWGFAAGTYTVYVKAIGKPFLRNKMSEGATLKIASTSSSTSSTTSAYGVRISSPVDNGTSGSTVHVVASATSSAPIIAMHVYVDNVKRVVTSSAKVDAWISMSLGSRYVVVQAWDSSGKIYKSSVTLKVE